MSVDDLQDPEQWDDASTEVHEPRPVDKRRAIVSVAFPSDDFAIVSQAARKANMKLSEFIRVAAIQATKPAKRTRPLSLRMNVPGTSIGAYTNATPAKIEIRREQGSQP